MKNNYDICVISDTHDLLRPEVVKCIAGCKAVLHAGDIGSRSVLSELQRQASVYAVQGNADEGWGVDLPRFIDSTICGIHFYMTHKKKDLPKDLNDYDLVIYGHSHQYAETWLDPVGRKRTFLLNPGSCGPRRFIQPITMTILTVDDGGWIAKRIDIPHSSKEFAPKVDDRDIHRQIEIVVKETQKGQTVETIAKKHKLDPALVEQIVRLYVTHPGVTVDGIMTKMGLLGKL